MSLRHPSEPDDPRDMGPLEDEDEVASLRHCDYCGSAFKGRAYHDVDDYDTVCAHCELMLERDQTHRGQ